MRFAVTERGTFRRCRRQAYLSSKNGLHLTSLMNPIYLNVGTLVHEGHQEWLLHPETSMREHVMNASHKWEGKVKENYAKRIGMPPTSGEMVSVYEAIGFAISMAENYELRWGSPLPEGYKIVAPEQKIQIPVEATRKKCPICVGYGELGRVSDLQYEKVVCTNCDGTGEEVHYLEGKLDGLLQHHSGRLDILEHKTYGNRPRKESLDHTDQFLAYMWMARKLGVGDVGCTAYDGMWRRHEPPKGKTLEDLFSRYSLTRSQAEFDEFEKFLPLELEHMAELYRAPVQTAYPNRDWRGCWDCKLEPVCTSMSRGENYEMVIRNGYTQRTDDVEEEDESAD